jgi:hypothetical protein
VLRDGPGPIRGHPRGVASFDAGRGQEGRASTGPSRSVPDGKTVAVPRDRVGRNEPALAPGGRTPVADHPAG